MSQVPPSGLRRRGWGLIIALAVVSLLFIGWGAFPLWLQHSGQPARVTVEDCIKPTSVHITSLLIDYIDGTCSTMIDGKRVEIAGAHPKDLNHDVAVHVRGTEAALDGWSVPPIMLSVGGLLAAGAVAATVRRLAQRGP